MYNVNMQIEKEQKKMCYSKIQLKLTPTPTPLTNKITSQFL